LIELRSLGKSVTGIRDALAKAVGKIDIAADAEALAGALVARDGLLVLIDGLDEVADLEARVAVSRWIEEALAQLPRSVFVVTSRYAGYRGDSRLDGRFLELHVRDLEEDAARRFMADWYLAVETQAVLDGDAEAAAGRAAEQAGELAAKVFDEEDRRTLSLRKMAENPLMLQILCLVHRDRKTLPERRVELYRECVLVLLELWRRAKKMPIELDAEQALHLLQPLAWALHEAERREAPLEELLPHLKAPLRELRRDLADGPRLLEAIRDQSGVLVWLGQRDWAFLHLSFQEYLCALHVQDRVLDRQEVILFELAEHFGEPWWREVILLALGLNRPGLFGPLMAEVIGLGMLHVDPLLADDCLRDALATTPRPFLEALALGVPDSVERFHVLRVMQRVAGWEEMEVEGAGTGREVVEGLRGDEDAAVRGKVGELLGLELAGRVARAGEERVHEVDGSVLVFVPGGVYTLGADISEREKPIHRVELSPFWIGKYPVTNAQYALFLEARPEQAKPEYWDNKQFNQPDQPVVGVSWDEAGAYCAWAELMLPSEAQWEAAARGGDQRRFPWGDAEPTAELANFDRKVGRTSHVGSYPEGVGPFGTLDQAGNVWEWCLDVWDERAYAERDGRRDPVAEGTKASGRVVRGGSWAYQSWGLRASYRFWSHSGSRVRSLGFRVVVGPPPEP
jgi:formylglycine-generating enzyme required for sulfatase activity